MSSDAMSDDSFDEDDYYYGNHYYATEDNEFSADRQPSLTELENFKFEVLKLDDVELLLNESVDTLSKAIKVDPSLAKLLLLTNKWALSTIVEQYRRDKQAVLRAARVLPESALLAQSFLPSSAFCGIESTSSRHSQAATSSGAGPSKWSGGGRRTTPPVSQVVQTLPLLSASGATPPIASGLCEVCFFEPDEGCGLVGLSCLHFYCIPCWRSYIATQLDMGLATEIECMGDACTLRATEKFVGEILKGTDLRERYIRFAFRDLVESHPELRFCPGGNCNVVIRAPEPKAKRVLCGECGAEYCFQCGVEYHAPMECRTIQLWLTKCRDDSETANYISANTKDCPMCHVCIEKNGGCNHMLCCKCKYEFCWMCLGDWKAHQAEYYECSRYKENPNIVNESVNAQARDALKKYLFYYERWENHEKSLRLEDEQLSKIRTRINSKVMNLEGTWIDWQHLLTAAEILRKCRYTLKYTYPYAYYMGKKPRKDLFEYQQGVLEAEVENLSWMMERAEITDRGDLENKMDVCEKQRLTLLHEFLAS